MCRGRVPAPASARTAGARLLPFGMFPSTLHHGSAKMAAALGTCLGVYFFSKALNVLTPILAHLPAESGGSSSQAQAHVPTRHTSMQGDAAAQRGQLR